MSAAVTFGGGGEKFAAAISQGTIQVWNPVTGRLLNSFLFEGSVRGLNFSRDSRYLLVRGMAGIGEQQHKSQISIWDLQLGRAIWTRYYGERIHAFHMTPGGTNVLVAHDIAIRATGDLGISLEWLYWRPQDLVRAACARIDFRLSDEERLSLFPRTSTSRACDGPG